MTAVKDAADRIFAEVWQANVGVDDQRAKVTSIVEECDIAKGLYPLLRVELMSLGVSREFIERTLD